MNALLFYILPVAAFLLGAIPFSYLTARVAGGIDIRQHGSGNPGASNVYRVVGPGPGLLAFALDALKGAVPLLVAAAMADELSAVELVWYKILLGALAVMGHIWSPFLGFRGGKGVATVVGVFAVLFPLGLLTAAMCGLSVVFVYRFFSLGSLVGLSTLPVAYFLLIEQPLHPASLPLLYLSLLAVVLIFLRHMDNIKRLLQGKEHGIQQKS